MASVRLASAAFTRTLAASLVLLPLAPSQLLAGESKAGPTQLSLVFTVTSKEGANGNFPAMLTIKKGVVTGYIYTINLANCYVSNGSTDIKGKLNLTCTIGSQTTDTYIGTLSLKTGRGRGKFTDSYFKEKGKYTVALAQQ